ncbi:MAG: DUF2505 domain-containing protein [Kineosporiaceae bacterium]
MRVSFDTIYAADPDLVVDHRLQEDFLAEVARRTGALAQEVEVTAEQAGAGRSLVRRTVPTTDFPDVARRFVGDTLVIVEEVEWAPRDGRIRSATARMHAEGMPVQMDGRIELRPSPEGSLETVNAEIKARVPLVGGRIEKAIEPALREGLALQAAVLLDRLAG